MSQPTIAPYGSWRSPVSAALVAGGGVSLNNVFISGQDVYWNEGRPREGGRNVVVRRSPNGRIRDVTPSGYNVRTRVHEYGGGAYLVHGQVIFFSNFADQRLYRQDLGQAPAPITPDPEEPAGARYADGCLTPDGRTLICVRELHRAGQEVVNEIVDLPADGSAAPRSLVAGADFYACPRLSPDGKLLAWLRWDHPNMPWDGTELWVAERAADGGLSNAQRVAGGVGESVFQPSWSPEGALYFASDRTGWWNLYRVRGGTVQPMAPMEAEFGVPQWVFGGSTYAFLEDGRIACMYSRDGFDHLALITPGNLGLETLDTPFTSLGFPYLRASGSRLAFIGSTPTEAAAVVLLDVDSGETRTLRRSVEFELAPASVSVPRSIVFPTEGGLTAHALFYPPTNPDFAAPSGDRPPLLVVSHGGPTSMTPAAFSPAIQFWTSRGFGVVDVNYGGSSGFGRAYRQRLDGQWGVVDTLDCINAASYLAAQGLADEKRLAIRGGSAGGYTTLCALAFHDVFSAGASYYGVADCEALARDTHKFELRYLDRLIGPYPAARELYYQRSPVHFAGRISCPMILFQGLEDKVVPPEQAEAMVCALQEKGLPYAYLAFEGEQHGFRKAETIQRTLEAELYFYGRVFGFTPADDIEPVAIENL
ncbi:MAG: S9 family peptidase [Chloroflexota bacterium]|nr:S9 family peptidase [Chloroflexota bacterium]